MRADMAEIDGRAARAGRRLHAGDGVAGRRATATSASTSIREVLPYDADAWPRLIERRRRRRARASSRSPSPRPATTSTPQDRLDLGVADLAADLERRARRAGSTIYGAVCAILRRAHARAAAAPVTLLNCDNLRHNGDALSRGPARLPRAPPARPRCAPGSQANTSCPNAMVDRITPRPPPDCAERVQGGHRLGRRRAGDGRELHPVGRSRTDFIARPTRPGSSVGVRDGRFGARPTRRRRSASSTPATAASPGPARWSACSYIHEGTHDAGDPRAWPTTT